MGDVALTYIVVVNYNGSADTIECLNSLFVLVGSPFRVVIVDNGSWDGSAAAIERWLQSHESVPAHGGWTTLRASACEYQAILVRNRHNLGFAGGCNTGIRLALADRQCAHIWLLNNDTVVTPQALTALVDRCAADDRIGLCGSTLVYHHLGNVIQACGGSYSIARARGWQLGNMMMLDQRPAIEEVEQLLDYVVGASMLVSRKFVEAVGILDERYFLYFEELDWAVRGREKGFIQAWARDSIVFHKEGASIGSSTTGKPSSTSTRFMTSSYLRFVRRHRPALLPKAITITIARMAKWMAKGDVARSYAITRGLAGFLASPDRHLAAQSETRTGQLAGRS